MRAPWEASWARLESLGDVLGEFQAPLRDSWGVLACLGTSWGRLGIDFRSNGEVDSGISSWMPFSNRYPPGSATKNRSPILESLNSIEKNMYCLLSGSFKITSLPNPILLPI